MQLELNAISTTSCGRKFDVHEGVGILKFRRYFYRAYGGAFEHQKVSVFL